MIKNVGILTWHYYSNYGSQLQSYALIKAIRGLGFSCSIINYRNSKFGKPSIIKAIAQNIVLLLHEKVARMISPKLYLPGLRFRKFFNQTSAAYDSKRLRKITRRFDAVVCGSDQIWAPNVYNPIYMLNFVPDNIRKVSYAASIGLNDIPQNLVEEYRKYISRLDYVSVREAKGAELLQEQCGISSSVVLDPTLLITSEDWLDIARYPLKGSYIFCYLLKENHSYAEKIREFANALCLPVYAVSMNPKDKEWANILQPGTLGPQDFIGLINNSKFVITDSYHGTIFSLLLHKEFITLERFSSSDTICQNSRLEQLKTYFDISNRIVNSGISNSFASMTNRESFEIDWIKFEYDLAMLRKASITYLTKALS